MPVEREVFDMEWLGAKDGKVWGDPDGYPEFGCPGWKLYAK